MLAPSSEIEESVDLDNIGKSFIDAFSTDLRMGSSIGTMGTEIAGTLGFQSWEPGPKPATADEIDNMYSFGIAERINSHKTHWAIVNIQYMACVEGDASS
ncbi:MAG: hypothetical protein L6R41_003739 [Letrouitia leprolyta]|nr:MAG: hypothetical protein L6R41_003739 [Letrouitia leprolyta]